MKEDDKLIVGNLIFWSIVFGIVLCSLMLDNVWQMVGFWFALYAAGWIIKKECENGK